MTDEQCNKIVRNITLQIGIWGLLFVCLLSGHFIIVGQHLARITATIEAAKQEPPHAKP